MSSLKQPAESYIIISQNWTNATFN